MTHVLIAHLFIDYDYNYHYGLLLKQHELRLDSLHTKPGWTIFYMIWLDFSIILKISAIFTMLSLISHIFGHFRLCLDGSLYMVI